MTVYINGWTLAIVAAIVVGLVVFHAWWLRQIDLITHTRLKDITHNHPDACPVCWLHGEMFERGYEECPKPGWEHEQVCCEKQGRGHAN